MKIYYLLTTHAWKIIVLHVECNKKYVDVHFCNYELVRVVADISLV